MLDKITFMFELIGSHSGIQCFSADRKILLDGEYQDVTYPYVTYKIMSVKGLSDYQKVTFTVKNEDETVDEITGDRKNVPVSVNVIGQEDELSLYPLAENILRELKKYRTGDFVVRIISPEIETRSAFIETDYEYKVGFDLRIDYTEKSVEKNIPVITGVEIGGNIIER